VTEGPPTPPRRGFREGATPGGSHAGPPARRADYFNQGYFDPDETAYLPVIDPTIAHFVPPAPVVRHDIGSRAYRPLHSGPHPSVAQRAVDTGEAPVGEPEGTEVPESLDESIDKADRKNLGRNSILMASGTLASRVLGMVNATLQAWVLGQSVAADAFKAANTLPNFILVLLSGGILNAILVPQITKAMKRPDGGKDYVDRLLTATFMLVIAVAALCTAGAAVFIRVFTSLSGPGLHLAISFAFLCMPQVLFYGVFAVLGNILNARGSFGAYGWAPVANNVVAIIGEIVFLRLWGQQDDPTVWTSEMVWVLAGTATFGILIQTIVLLPFLRRTGFRWSPRWGLRGYGFGQVGRFAGLTFLALVIAQGGGLLIMKVATYLPINAGDEIYVPGYAAYQNALSLFQVPYSLIGISLLTALFPQLARAWQRRDEPGDDAFGMQALLRKGLTLPAVGIIPASAVLISLAGPIVSVIYFTLDRDEASATAALLMVMASSTLPYTIATLQQQYCFATEQGRTNLWMQCLSTGIQVTFALLSLTVPAHNGMAVLCLGMLVSNTTLALVFVWYARRQVGGLGLSDVLRLYVRLGLASVIGGLAAWGASVLVLSFGEAWAWQALALGLGALVFVAVFTLAARIMHITEYFDLLNPVLRRLHLPQL